MQCIQARSDETLEGYLVGRLSDSEMEQFDTHLLECTDCQDALERLVALRDAISQQRDAIAAESSSSLSNRRWVLVAAAAVVIVGLGVTSWLTRSRSEGLGPAELAKLASFKPPHYEAPLLRSAGSDAERLFLQAMESYVVSDYAGAIPDLEAAAGLGPGDAASHFFLGVCQLATKAPESAISSFLRVIELEPTPYAERARLYLAKAYLLVGQVEEAKSELEIVVRFAGESATEAREILERLAS